MIDGVYPDTGMGQFLLATYLGIVYALDIICVSCISYRYDPRYISFLLPLFVSNCIFWEKKSEFKSFCYVYVQAALDSHVIGSWEKWVVFGIGCFLKSYKTK